MFWRSDPCLRYHWQICFPILLVLFILMLFSLTMQKLFILMRSHLFILSFMSLALRDVSVDVAEWNVRDFPANVFLKDFYGVTTYI